jgi:F-type H+-transporting ATPase subunit epsilon
MADQLPTKLNLTVVTRERKIIDVEVDEVELPAFDGEIGVLPGHTPLLTALKIGQMRYRVAGRVERMVLSWGFAEVLPDRVIVMAESARLAEEIDPAAAERERVQAEKELASLASHDEGFALVQARIEESVAMIRVARR